MGQRIRCACVFLSFCIFASLTFVGCVSPRANSPAPGPTAAAERDPDKQRVAERVTSVTATLSKTGSSPWAVEETRVAGRETLRSIHFLDLMNGWAGGKGVLYQTADGGKTWRRVGISLPENASVTQVVFLNPSAGWVVAQKEAASPERYEDNHFWLMHTSDGGQNWKVQLEGENSVIDRLRVADSGEAWLVGTRYTNRMPLRADEFIYHTTDLGEHWLDVAGELNRMLKGGNIKLGFTDVLPQGPLTASVLLPRGSVFKTEDGGQSWRQLNATVDDRSFICSCHMGITDDNRLWVGGGKTDSKSYRGMVAVKEDDSWREYYVNGVSFSDILFLSRSRILTSGSSALDEEEPIEKGHAALSYSSDGGATWSFVYLNQKAGRLNALSAVGPDSVWAVGDDGLVLRLDAARQRSANAPSD